MKRREFIQLSVIGGTAMTVAPFISCKGKKPQAESQLAKRKLGSTGEMISCIGFGGVLVRDEEQIRANDMVALAFDKGVNYFDVAPTYGNAEEKLGPALQPYRDKSFLACKTMERDREGAEKELHASLNKLKTDHFDLYQLHALTEVEDVEKAFGPDGAMETILKARQEGKIRFIGFSAHSEQAALLAMEKFDFDTVLFPINFVCWYQGNFGPRVVVKAQEKKMGILALKALAFTTIKQGEEKPYEKLWYHPIEDKEVADLAVRFTLSQGTTAAIPPGEAKYFWQALEIAKNSSPLTEAETGHLRKISEGVEPLFKTV